MKPSEVRALIREGKITTQTSGMCDGYAQANLIILPMEQAYDFLLFAQRNPKSCPLLEVGDKGSRLIKRMAQSADVATDIPKYRVWENGVDIISDGIVEGSIQIPASGTPIIMMADRQTTGGYAKIATVITVDLPLVAQARPGTVIRFRRVGNKEAVKALEKRTKLLQKYKKKIKGN